MQSPRQSSPSPQEMDKDETLLSRVAVNHLFLSQFEAFRAIILSLKRRNPELALAILQTVVANGGKFENIIYSSNCSSPALLAWLCSSELLRFDNPSSIWSVSPELIKLRVEFLLYMQMISDKVPDEARDSSGVDGSASVAVVLHKLKELGFRRLKEDLVVVDEREHAEFLGGDRFEVEENEEEQLKCLMPMVLDNADVFDALFVNISKQVGVTEHDYDSSGLALALRREGEGVAREEDVRVMKSIRKIVQLAHLEAMEVGISEDDLDGVTSHIQYLHLDSGVEETNYRAILRDFLKKILSRNDGYGDAWIATREKLLLTYQGALSSSCTRLVQMIQAVQDELLVKEIEASKSYGNQILRPLQQFQDYLAKLKLHSQTNDGSSFNLAMSSCLTDLYHYARVAGLHVLDCVVDAALSAVKKENLEEASNILNLYPRLRPLVAIMGWDLLPNKTAARRKLMQLLWTSKLQAYRLEASSLDGNLSDERSCIEHFCDALCYQLDIASYVACVNSGKSWDLKTSLFFYDQEKILFEDECADNDTFVKNYVLERLSFQSPLRVLFDVVPNIIFKDAMELIRMQPVSSNMAAWKRKQDIELVRMRYGIEYAAMAIGAMEKEDSEDTVDTIQMVLHLLKDLKHHIEAIESIPRKIFMVNIIISLLHMNNISANWEYCGSPWRLFEGSSVTDEYSYALDQGENRTVILVIETLLGILRHNIPLQHTLEENELDNGLEAMEWRISSAISFVDDWEWRLLILKQLLPFSDGKWKWKEAVDLLRAAPSKLLNICMQRGNYGIGEVVVGHFSLPPEDKATLTLAEWAEHSFKEVSVEDADARTFEEKAALKEIDFPLLRTQIGPLATILLCIDVAVASARSKKVAHLLLDQAQSLLSEIYPGGSPKIGSAFWDQIREVALISLTKRLLKCLNEILEQENTSSLQAALSGEITVTSSHRQGQRDRALAMLHQMIEDAHEGKRQFLSGKLHNLARAVADEESGIDNIRSEGTYREQKFLLEFDSPGILGLGLRGTKQASSSPTTDHNVQPASYDMKEAGKRIYGPLSVKPTTYLSQFILHISAIGDIVDGADTTHDFNYFSLVYEWPKDLVTRLVFEQASTEAAEKVAEIMSTDFVHEVISACVPPVYPPQSGHGWACIPLFPPNWKSRYGSQTFSSSAREFNVVESGVTQYPLQLDVIRHLAKASPVRAVLACVFGSRMLRSGSESSAGSLENELIPTSDIDRMFYEFALDQSERFPTLNRWIQMQTNRHRVSEFTEASKDTTIDVDAKAEVKLAMKRAREEDSESELEVELSSAVDDDTPATPDLTFPGSNPSVRQGGLNFDVPEDAPKLCLTFDWENEGPYEKAVDRLIEEGNLLDALALSDRFLSLGASDHLLKLLIEQDEENITGSLQRDGVQSAWSNNWQYCLRLKDKQLAAKLALKNLHRWELDASLDVLTMCSCHLPHDELLKSEVLQRRKELERYKRILCADDYCTSWQEVEAMSKEDPEGLALKLAERGAVSAALEVAESACLSIDLRRELQGRQLVKLLTADPLNGGGPAEASRFLSSLRESEDALPVVMGAMQLLPDLRSKQLLVHFFLKRRDGNLTDTAVSRLNSWAVGLKVLSALPLPWQQRCSSLHEHPHLILEVLLMRKQFESASLILKEFPSLQDNSVILTYAAKAISVSICSPSREPRVSVSGQKMKQKIRTTTPTKPSLSSSLSNLHREARRAFSWNARNVSEKPAPKEAQKKRKSPGLMEAERNAWEAMTGIQEDRVSSFTADGQEKRLSASIAEEWMLTGDVQKDESMRASHRYDSAPDVTLFKSLLSLSSDESVSARGAMDLCVSQMKIVLSSKQLPETATTEIIARAYRATEAFVQGLLHARSLLRKLVGGSDTSSNYERSRDTDDTSSDAGSSSVGSQAADEISELLLQADMWLRRAELLQSLLGSGISASLDDIADKESSSRLRDRLIADERYGMAVYTCRKCKIDVFPVWNAWGHALLRTEHYDQARVKFKQVLQLYDDDPVPIIQEIINTIEGSPPVAVSIARSMYEHLAKSAPAILDDSLSADSYLNVLHMPSTYPRSERSGSSLESTSDGSISLIIDDGPQSNLDSMRYLECVNYLQEYTRQDLLHFMFRHGHFEEACTLFFPPNSVPPPPQPSSHRAVTTSSSPQRADALATDYGTIDDLCDICIGYGVMSVLEEVVSARKDNAASQDLAVNQHTDAALARICNYCETHKHFNYLYKFQVIKKDHVAAGLCCVQLFINSSSVEDAITHLENAKMHFDEGLSARHKAGESTKVVTKGVRGRSATEKLTGEGLMKLSTRVAIQVDVVRSFNDTEGPQWKYSLFGNPNDQETFRRRCQVAESLVEKNFDLAFRVIVDFGLPAVDIYAAVAASLAERKRAPQLTELFKNIKGTVNDDDWDQVLGAAINVYANKHKERPDRLIDMLTSSHRKVLACVVSGRLKTAFQFASRSGSVADVQYVAHQALHSNALPVLDMCKQWLAQYM